MNREMMVTSATEVTTKDIQEVPVPALGFGTFELEGDTCRAAVETALATGYRHLDTARMYGNEAEIGAALEISQVPREEIFLTSKAWREQLDPASVERELETSLRLLKTDYLDLFLIHWPNPEVPLEATIEAMEKQREKGLTRQIGVSNFPPSWFKRAIACGAIFCNQVEYHALLGQEPVLEIARAHDILLTAYSPLAQGEVAEVPVLKEIAEEHGKTVPQIAIRWLLEQDHVAAIPRSSNPSHIESNFDVFDFPNGGLVISMTLFQDRNATPDHSPEFEVPHQDHGIRQIVGVHIRGLAGEKSVHVGRYQRQDAVGAEVPQNPVQCHDGLQ